MKNLIFIAFIFLSFQSFGQNKKKEHFNLTNALIVALMNQENERYSLEIALTEFFADRGVNCVPSLNILKQGSDQSLLATDSLRNKVRAKNIDTYMLVAVRGYDSRFKKSAKQDDLATALDYGTLFGLYRDEVTSVTFEFFFYRNDTLVKSQLIRVSNVSSDLTVIKRLKKKLARKMKRW